MAVLAGIVEDGADLVADVRAARLAGEQHRQAELLQVVGQEPGLDGLAAAFHAFKGDEHDGASCRPAARAHADERLAAGQAAPGVPLLGHQGIQALLQLGLGRIADDAVGLLAALVEQQGGDAANAKRLAWASARRC